MNSNLGGNLERGENRFVHGVKYAVLQSISILENYRYTFTVNRGSTGRRKKINELQFETPNLIFSLGLHFMLNQQTVP